MQKRKLNILVLAGGESAERDVSLDSSRAIARTLLESGHQVRVLDSLSGRYLTDEKGNYIEDSDHSSPPAVDVSPSNLIPTGEIIKARDNLDVVFIGLHGGSGENGRVQAILDMLGISYTGSPMAASAVAMNKDISKRIMRTLGIPTAQWRAFDFSLGLTAEDILNEFEKNILPPLPVVIKPTDGGSTIGLTLVENPDQISEAIRAASAVSPLVMVEKYIAGREITIAVLDRKPLPPVEIKPTHKLYDYTCKYTKGKSAYFCPADIEDDLAEKLSRDALLFYDTIGCRGYARVDFIVAPDGTYDCLELNTLPGMTELSLFPMAAKAVGMSFGDLLDKLCHLALGGK
jgi:D-alanine-D-alanine ligase